MIRETESLNASEYRSILQRVGIALIIFGLVDIGFAVYCILHKISYSSSFNIFAVIAGIFLVRGNLSAARIISFFSAFMLTGITGILLFSVYLFPLELISIWWRQNPVFAAFSLGYALVAIILLYWTYFQLRRMPIIEAGLNAGQNTAVPWLAFGAGIVLAVFLGGMSVYTFKGPVGEKALQLARARYGNEYHYIITGISSSGHHMHVELDAYNTHASKHVTVDWDR